MTTPPPAPDRSTPQVLLFGHTGAGKSALLGALFQAGETQGETLGGEIVEPTNRLASLRNAIYNGTEIEQGDAEITSYTVRVRPWRVGTQAVTEPFTIVLNDCSGKAAESLIQHPAAIADPFSRAPVARAVIEADAIVLMVDATADDDELQEAFEEFDTFLTVVSQAKANAREVGGFPVFLVLTHCDELAKPGDTWAKWEARVEARADRAWTKFDAFLKDANPDDGIPSPFLPFGSVDLTVYATAVRLPKLVDSPAQPQTPYGVAALFHDCFATARVQRKRVAASDHRLKWTVRIALAFVSFLFLGIIAIAILQPKQADPGLAEKIEAHSVREGPPSERLADANIGRNKRILTAFRDDPGFLSLPDHLRQFVLVRLKEIDDYDAYRAGLALPTVMTPGEARNETQLEDVKKALQQRPLQPPPEYSWEGTPAVELVQKWLEDVAAIKGGVARFLNGYSEPDPANPGRQVFHEGYTGLNLRGAALAASPSLGGSWRDDVNALLAAGSQPPAPLNDPLPGSREVKQPRGQALTNRVPYEFVYHSRSTWNNWQDELRRLRDLADALGLTAGSGRPPAVLDWPEPGPGVDSATLPRDTWQGLPTSVTADPEGYKTWKLDEFTDRRKPALVNRLEKVQQTGARHVHALILAKIGPDPEQKDTAENWATVAGTLKSPPFPEWGRVLHLLARLRNPAAPEPIAELEEFLRRKSFDIDLRELTIGIPRTFPLDRVVPAGPFTVTIVPRGREATTIRLKQAGAPERDDRVFSYTFVPDGNVKATYRPGDELRAELPVRIGTEDRKLVWETSRSQAYQFDKLANEPRLVKPGGLSDPAPGVTLTPSPTSLLPRVPLLFPDMRR